MYYGLSNQCLAKAKEDLEKYCKILYRVLLPFAAEKSGEMFTFEQDD